MLILARIEKTVTVPLKSHDLREVGFHQGTAQSVTVHISKFLSDGVDSDFASIPGANRGFG
jgi:hypothetical protein